MRLLFFIFLIFSSNLVHAINCQTWFDQAKIKKDNQCLLKCATISTDMGSFDCPQSCDDFCKVSVKESFLFQISDLYPGLTAEEKALAAIYPTKILEAYQLSWLAESNCKKQFFKSDTNDASDACRHYLWAGLLVKNLGLEMAEKILNAHEAEPKQPENEKAMDLANNRRGMMVAEKLIKNNQFSEKTMMDSFNEDIKKKRLSVLKKD